jgi:hypothetical protein
MLIHPSSELVSVMVTCILTPFYVKAVGSISAASTFTPLTHRPQIQYKTLTNQCS